MAQRVCMTNFCDFQIILYTNKTFFHEWQGSFFCDSQDLGTYNIHLENIENLMLRMFLNQINI